MSLIVPLIICGAGFRPPVQVTELSGSATP